MLSYFVTRLAQAVVVVFAMSVIVFVGVFAIGNPIDVMIDPGATAEIRAQLIPQYGLDQPLLVPYWTFLHHVAHCHVGTSLGRYLPVC